MRHQPLPPTQSVATWDNETPTTGRADGCANTNIGPGRSGLESDVEPILHPAADTAQQTPGILHVERLGRLDGCIDACGNSELPYRIEITSDGFVGYYGCEDCGQFWHTSWRDDA